jgi:hypothetical protein
MREFFENDGSIFKPWLVLRGAELARLKSANSAPGSETLGGSPGSKCGYVTQVSSCLH